MKPQATSECLCKPNVEAGECNSCKDGFFNLQESDPLGCMECFCFGRSSTCSSHPTLIKSQIISMDDWDHATFTFTGREAIRSSLDISAQANYGGEIRMDASSLVDIDVDLGSQTYYYQSSGAYSGSQIESYGSSLTWNITYWGRVDPDSKKTPDVILKGGDSMLLYFSGKTAPEGGSLNMEVPLLPLAGQWLTPSGNAVDRKAFMTILNRLDNIYIKGSYGTDGGAVTTLGPVALGTGRQVQGAVADEQRAGGVELCDCPDGYTGFSCQLCSPGYFSVREDSGSPICEPCDCNGHAETCHPKTGACEPLTIPMDILGELMMNQMSCDDDTVGCSQRIVDGTPSCHECGVYGSPLDYCHFNPEKCEVLPIEGEGVDNGHCADNTRGKNCELCDPG